MGTEGNRAKRGRQPETAAAEAREVIEHMFGSTHWEMRRVKITRAPQATGHSAPKGHRWRRLPTRNPRQPLQVTVQYRGGAQGWIEVHARGDFGRFPGDTTLLELVMWVNSNGSL